MLSSPKRQDALLNDQPHLAANKTSVLRLSYVAHCLQMCKPLLDPVTKEKVRFIDVDAAGKAEMETQFHMDQVRQAVARCSLFG